MQSTSLHSHTPLVFLSALLPHGGTPLPGPRGRGSKQHKGRSPDESRIPTRLPPCPTGLLWDHAELPASVGAATEGGMTMNVDLSGRVAIVSGASAGLG